MTTINIEDRRYGCKILLHRCPHICADPTLLYYVSELKFKTYTRFLWYFRYRSALAQVQNPRRFVEFVPFQYEYIPSEIEVKNRLKNKLISAKAKTTQWKNQLERIKQNWNSLFPIEDDPRYQNALDKIRQKEQEVSALSDKLNACLA